MSLIRLIYVSSSHHDLETEELDRILASSVRHNSPQAVTGMLLYARGSFMQVLEGEERAVEETFARVEKDPRHTAIVVIERAPIAEREFERWSMGFRRLDAGDAERNPAYAPFFERGFDASAIGAHSGLALDMLTFFGISQDSTAAGGY